MHLLGVICFFMNSVHSCPVGRPVFLCWLIMYGHKNKQLHCGFCAANRMGG